MFYLVYIWQVLKMATHPAAQYLKHFYRYLSAPYAKILLIHEAI